MSNGTIKEGRCSIKKVKNYFSHDFNARNDIKLKKVNMELGMTGIGLYWCIVECLYENGGYLDLEQIDLLAYELRVEKELIIKLIERYDLFKTNKKAFYSKSVLQRIAKINEISKKNKENIAKRWAKNKEENEIQTKNEIDTTVLQSNYKKKEKKRKEKKINNSVCNNNAREDNNNCHLGSIVKNESCFYCMKKNQCTNPESSEFKLKHEESFDCWNKRKTEEINKLLSEELKKNNESIDTDIFNYDWLNEE